MKILIACFPKSGSTYLYNLIGMLPGFEQCVYVPVSLRREQELDDLCMGRYNNCEKQVAQLHVRASGHTLDLLIKFSVTPVVLVRNIFDCVVSIADHLSNETVEMPMAYFEPYFNEMTAGRKIEAIIDLVVPWYFNFYVSWWRAKPTAIVTYEDVVLGGLERQHRFLQSIGLQVSYEDIDAAQKASFAVDSRFNSGVAGRGLDKIGHDLYSKVYRMARYYKDVDFSAIGIAPGC